jgi:DNA-binding NtrC family response regulator
MLVEHFMERFAPKGSEPSISARAWAALSEYRFPGNVRELEHAIHHGVVLARGGEIDLQHLPGEIAGQITEGSEDGDHNGGLQPLSHAVRAFEREYLLRALRLAGGRKTQAAQMLGISRKNLWEKLRAQGVQESEWNDQKASGTR